MIPHVARDSPHDLDGTCLAEPPGASEQLGWVAVMVLEARSIFQHNMRRRFISTGVVGFSPIVFLQNFSSADTPFDRKRDQRFPFANATPSS
ncbi:MAG: hypothetical protein ACRD21_12695, partial [Vicinamibacteria bacterium]